MSEIPSTPADGNVCVLVVPAIADLEAVPVASLTGAGVVDISCYLTGDGYNPSLDQQVIADERLCSTETFEQPGRAQRGLETTYIDNTNAPNEATDNKAKETLVPYSTHVIAVRRGIAWDTAPAADQTWTFSPIKAGLYNDLPPEANSVLKTQQKQFITGRTVTSKLVA